MNKKVAIYAGSFNPFHKGHLDILQQSEELFGVDNVIIAVGSNPAKSDSEKTLEDRTFRVKMQLPDKTVLSYSGFLPDFIFTQEEQNPDVEYWLVRGLRNGEDLNVETIQLQFMKDMKPDMKTVFFVCDKKYDHISSSAIRLIELKKPASAIQYLGKSNPTFIVLRINQSNVIHHKIVLESVRDSEPTECEVVFKGGYEDCLDIMLEANSRNI